MQHFKLVNWRIRGFVFWCHEQVTSFQLSWQNGLIWAVMEILLILLKHPTFEVVSLCFHGQKQYKIRVSAHCSVRTKKLINCRSLVNLQELLFLLVFQVFKPSLKKPWNKAEILLDWRRKIKKRANQLKGLDDNSTETQVSFDDFLMVVVIPDDSSKCKISVRLWNFKDGGS